MQFPYRPEFEHEEPYGAPQLAVDVRLNTNENPYPPSALVREAMERAAGEALRDLNRYPDRDFAELRKKISAYLAQESGVAASPNQIWAANGSNEIMAQLLTAFAGPGRKVMTFVPSYSMYSEYARNTFSQFVARARGDDFRLDLARAQADIERERPAIILLASPNNPTGTALDFQELRAILHIAAQVEPQGAPGARSLVVVDEAYAEFRREGVPSALELLEEYPHLVVTRTMSKAFAAAGLRLGYAVADPRLIAQLNVVRLPYHLSSLTQAVACAALDHAADLQANVAQIRADRDALVDELRNRRFEVLQSDANFICFGRFSDRHREWERVLAQGVLIRETGPAEFLRVTVGTTPENRAFLDALGYRC